MWSGVMSGKSVAFEISFEEVVVLMFPGVPGQTTLLHQIWSNLQDQLSQTILAAASLLIIISALVLLTLELQRRSSVAPRHVAE
jgi:putative spermidine/putrescine transport system permease protein